MEKYYTIKEAAAITGLSEYTLRFYENEKLIVNIKRDNNNYRLYSDFDIKWINFLTKVKSTSMPLTDIRHYADLMAQGDCTIYEREQMLLEHRKKILEQIENLNSVLLQIDQKLGRYQRIKQGIGQSDLEIYKSLQKTNI
jgi:DNA-binding transcriptional MerR regulator